MKKNHSLQHVSCCFCGNEETISIERFISNDLIQTNKSLRRDKKSPIGPSPSKFTAVLCKICGLSYINPRLSEKQLLRFYEGFYSKEFQGDNVAFEKSVYNIINIQQENGRLQEIERFIKRGKILDIGAGPGHFLKIGKDAGWDVYGQDLSKHAAAIAQKDFGIKVYDGTLKSLPYPDKFFDVVTMHSTIEHSLNPMTYIKIAYQKLKPGGLLVFSVPNVRSINFFLAKVLKLPYPGFIFEHLYYFTPRLIATMLTDKFTLVEMTSYHHSRPLYPQESKPKTQQKPKNKYAVFLKEIRQTKQKKLYIRQRFYTFQMRILREVLEYNRIGGKLQMGDVLYIFARKKVND